jgi:hypothetical protein
MKGRQYPGGLDTTGVVRAVHLTANRRRDKSVVGRRARSGTKGHHPSMNAPQENHIWRVVAFTKPVGRSAGEEQPAAKEWLRGK